MFTMLVLDVVEEPPKAMPKRANVGGLANTVIVWIGDAK
jgi:hypothetical protein